MSRGLGAGAYAIARRKAERLKAERRRRSRDRKGGTSRPSQFDYRVFAV